MRRILPLLLIFFLVSTSSSAQIPEIPKRPSNLQKELSLNKLDPLTVHTQVRKKITSRMKQASPVRVKVQSFIGPAVSKKTATQRLSQLQTAMAFWSNHYVPTSYKILLFGYDDVDYAVNTVKAEQIGYDSQLRDSILATTPEWCSFGNAGNPTSFYLCNPTKPYFENDHTVAHEYTHNMQFGLLANRVNLHDMPCWLSEGFASFYGMQLGFTDPVFTAYRNKMERGFAHGFAQRGGQELGKSVSEILKNGTDNEVLAMTNMVQVPTSLACVNVGQMAYLYGGAAVEVTIALWGVDAIPTFFKNYDPTVNWETNWQRQFGITSEQFHTAMIPFFRSFADHLN